LLSYPIDAPTVFRLQGLVQAVREQAALLFFRYDAT
jgi:hypothetical protein